jgi:hypothetical protein
MRLIVFISLVIFLNSTMTDGNYSFVIVSVAWIYFGL